MAKIEPNSGQLRSPWTRWVQGVQRLFDWFYDSRVFLFDSIAYLSIRVFAIELSFEDVRRGKYNSNPHVDR